MPANAESWGERRLIVRGDGLGLIGNTLVQVSCVVLLWVVVTPGRFLFLWVPR